MPTTRDIREIKEEAQKDLLKLNGVRGVGLGRKSTGGKQAGPVSIQIVVEKKIPAAELNSNQLIPSEINGIPTDVFELPRAKQDSELRLVGGDGDLRAYSPLRGGIRICPSRQIDPEAGYGTLGLVVQHQGMPCILTCSHLINVGPVFQPSKNGQRVADFTTNDTLLDASLSALNEFAHWTNWIVEIGTIQGSFMVLPEDTPYAVRKRGFKTGFSPCEVMSVDYSGYIENGELVYNTLLVSGPAHSFEAGDSGAVIVDDCARVVGMLRQNSGHDIAYASPITEMMKSPNLDFSIYTDNMPRLFAVHEGKGSRPKSGDGWLYGTYTDGLLTDFSGDAPWPIGVDTYNTLSSPILVTHKRRNQKTYDPNVVRESLFCLHVSKEKWGKLARGEFDGRNWLPDQYDWDFQTSGPPSAAVYKGNLYVFRAIIDGQGSDKRWLALLTSNGYEVTFEGLVPPNYRDTYGTTFAPATAVFNGKLYVVHQAQNSTGVVKVFTFDGSTWSGDDDLITIDGSRIGTSTQPALATFDGKLYLVHDTAGDTGWLRFTYFDGVQWANDQYVNFEAQIGSSGPINLIVHNGQLVCMREGRGDSQIIRYCTMSPGSSWVDAILRHGQNEITGHWAPGLAHFPIEDSPTVE